MFSLNMNLLKINRVTVQKHGKYDSSMRFLVLGTDIDFIHTSFGDIYA